MPCTSIEKKLGQTHKKMVNLAKVPIKKARPVFPDGL